MNVENNYFVNYLEKFPTYEEFYQNVMLQNRVCLFGSKLTEKWHSRQKWTNNGTVDFDYLQNLYGLNMAPVYNCNQKYFNSNPCNEMLFSDFINYWKMAIDQNYNYNAAGLDILYLKDWHCFQDTADSSPYEVLVYFESDYLNEYCLDNKLPDYRFVYMGPKDSSTPLHTDVFGSFSWSANICGIKEWLFIPLCNVPKLKDKLKQIPSDLYNVNGYGDIIKQTEGFKITQRPGEVLFVPSGYMHQVKNIEDTISINHNWFNACNLELIYNNLLASNKEIEDEISDIKETVTKREWQEKCQQLLIIHFGLNYTQFVDIIVHISNRLLLESKNGDANLKFRFLHDLGAIHQLTLKLKSNFQFDTYRNKIENILSKINEIKIELQ